MNTFIQAVFNKISLERNPKLWQSEDDILMPKRIEFLSQFDETKFSSQLFNEKNVSKSLRKNAVLCSAFNKKTENLLSDEEQEKKLMLLNQALCFCEVPENGSKNYDYCCNTYAQLLVERMRTLSRLKYTNEALCDVKVIEKYYNDLDHFDEKHSEYFLKLYQFKFNLVVDNSFIEEENRTKYRQQYQNLKLGKNWKEIQELIVYVGQNHPLINNSASNEGA